MEELNFEKLIKKVTDNHLTKISFKKGDNGQILITITAQAGNESGHIVTVIFTNKGNILNIIYEIGGYSDHRTVIQTINEHLGVRRNIIVTGTGRGLFVGGHHIHECDILSLSTAGYASEIEIKVSRSDLLNDKNKTDGDSGERHICAHS